MENHQHFIGGLWSTGGSSRGSTWISPQIWGVHITEQKDMFLSFNVLPTVIARVFSWGGAFSVFTSSVNICLADSRFSAARRRHPPQEKDDARSVAGKPGCQFNRHFSGSGPFYGTFFGSTHTWTEEHVFILQCFTHCHRTRFLFSGHVFPPGNDNVSNCKTHAVASNGKMRIKLCC